MTSILRANLVDPDHQSWFLDLLDEYMRHPMGDNRPMPVDNRERLVRDLSVNNANHILFAMIEGQAIGMAVCFVGYSTFYALPLVNIHDLFVKTEYRGSGIGLLLLNAVENLAGELGCCKVTLEVRDDNERAQAVYRQFGFDEGSEEMAFWAKKLSTS